MSYPEQGSPMDPGDHPAYNKPQATEHYAGDVIPIRIPANDNKNLDLGTGGFDVDAAWSSFRKQMSKPDLTVIPGGKK